MSNETWNNTIYYVPYESANVSLVITPADELIDELNLLTTAWQKNRDKKRPSNNIKRAIVDTSTQLVKVTENET